MAKIEVIYDERAEDYMYPRVGESEATFRKRMEALQKKLDVTLTKKEKLLAESLAKGKGTLTVIED
jgi:hypothetical protein